MENCSLSNRRVLVCGFAYFTKFGESSVIIHAQHGRLLSKLMQPIDLERCVRRRRLKRGNGRTSRAGETGRRPKPSIPGDRAMTTASVGLGLGPGT
jgi:hypothetical protein